MQFEHTDKTMARLERLRAFMNQHVFPNEQNIRDEIDSGDRFEPLELIEDLKEKAKESRLWNLFLPDVSGLSNLEYAPLAEGDGEGLLVRGSI